ncbi:MAG: putative zinc-binding protein [Dictyoglomaceae bacterium]
MPKSNWQILPHCASEAENLDIIVVCDGASSVGQVGNEVAIKLTKENEKARMCCMTAIAAGSKVHQDIAKKARKLIVINGCQLECASKVLRNNGIEPTYEITVAKEGVDKVPTLDFDNEDVERIAEKITQEVLKK